MDHDRRRRRNRRVALAAAWISLAGSAPAAAVTGAIQTVAFTIPSPLAAAAELLGRALSPLAAEAARRSLARSGRVLAADSLDLTRERFVLHVPPTAPADGYGLLVFVPPWDDGRIPPGWVSALDRKGLIFVAAERSGNAQSVVGRREALALTAVHNVADRYRIDPARVYVGGFSGGSRVAQRLALDYPDLFRGALLNAGSDLVGEGPDHLPAADLLRQAQEASRFVYVSGEQDSAAAMDGASLASLRRACIFDAETRMTPRAGHEAMDPQAFSRALDRLLRHTSPAADRLAACRAGLDRELAERERQAGDLIAAGRRDAARRAIEAIDSRFGCLAEAEVVALADKCACGIFDRSEGGS